MYPILFRLGSLEVRTYSIFLLLAFVLGILLIYYLVKRRTLLDPQIVVDLAFWVIIGVVVGARLAYVFMHWPQFAKDPAGIFRIWEGGAVYFGGFILALLTGSLYLYYYWFKRTSQHSFKGFIAFLTSLLDIMAPAIALGEGVGRWGCFFNGCCYGVPTKVCGITFPYESIPFAELSKADKLPLGALEATVWPTQILQSAGGILLFVVLILLLRRRLPRGVLFGIFLASFGTIRFGIDFLRYYEDAANYWTNQGIAIGLMVLGIGLAVLFGLTQEPSPSLEWAPQSVNVLESLRRVARPRKPKRRKDKQAGGKDEPIPSYSRFLLSAGVPRMR